MAKKTWRAAKFGKQKRNKATTDGMADRLSQLPDEILLAILSRLTMEEAARTTLLSHKWKELWRYYPILKFEDSKAMFRLVAYNYKKLIARKRSKFISRVNHIVEHHLGPSLDEFRVVFDLDNTRSSHIDKWVVFAFAKQVKTLKLDFSSAETSEQLKPYTLSVPLESHMLRELPRSFNSYKPALRSLCLISVNITAEVVECFLSSFPFLQNFRIKKADYLTCITTHSSLQLEHLEVICCSGLETIDLSVPKLVSFRYFGHPVKLNVRNASSLSDVSVGSWYESDITYAFDSLLNYYHVQLEKLELIINLEKFENMIEISQYPMLTNLKHIILDVVLCDNSNLLGWSSLLKAAPTLQKLTLQFSSALTLDRIEIVKPDPQPLKCLKTLEIVGIINGYPEQEFAMYVIENSMVLEEFIVDARVHCSKDEKLRVRTHIRASKLSKKLPKGAKLILK